MLRAVDGDMPSLPQMRRVVVACADNQAIETKLLRTAHRSAEPTCWRYELVEIPKALLQEAEQGKLDICRKTKQETRPGYCRIKDTAGNLKFELYFDAGSERKLQIRHLRKDLCLVHAQWEFATA